MTELDAFRLWVAYYSHFTTDNYDFIEYRGRVTATNESLEKRAEYLLYVASATKFNTSRELLEILLSGIDAKRVASPLFISEAIEQKIHKPEVLASWNKKVSSIPILFGGDVSRIIESGLTKNELLLSKRGNHPKLISLWEHGEISTETLKILDNEFNIFKLWDVQMPDNFIWEKHKFFITKYCRFINIGDRDYSTQLERFRRMVLQKQ